MNANTDQYPDSQHTQDKERRLSASPTSDTKSETLQTHPSNRNPPHAVALPGVSPDSPAPAERPKPVFGSVEEARAHAEAYRRWAAQHMAQAEQTEAPAKTLAQVSATLLSLWVRTGQWLRTLLQALRRPSI